MVNGNARVSTMCPITHYKQIVYSFTIYGNTRISLGAPHHHSVLPKKSNYWKLEPFNPNDGVVSGKRPTRPRHNQRKTNVMFGGITAIKRSSNSMPSKYKLIFVRVLNGLYPKFNWTWPRWMMEMMLRIVVMSWGLRCTSERGVDGQTDVLTWRQFSDGY